MIVLLTKHIICLGWFLKLKYYLSFVLSISIHEFIYILIRKADSLCFHYFLHFPHTNVQ